MLVCGAYKHIHTMEEKRMQKTNKKYRTKKLLLLVFPFSFLSVLVLVLLLLLLFSHLLPSLYPSLCLLLTYLLRTKQPRRPLKSPPTTAPCSLTVGLRRSRPELSRHCWSWLPDDRYQWRQTLLGVLPPSFLRGWNGRRQGGGADFEISEPMGRIEY